MLCYHLGYFDILFYIQYLVPHWTHNKFSPHFYIHWIVSSLIFSYLSLFFLETSFSVSSSYQWLFQRWIRIFQFKNMLYTWCWVTHVRIFFVLFTAMFTESSRDRVLGWVEWHPEVFFFFFCLTMKVIRWSGTYWSLPFLLPSSVMQRQATAYSKKSINAIDWLLKFFV